MKLAPNAIGDDDLHAYVDGRLDAEGRARVERHLADHPEAAARMAAWQENTRALKEALAFKTAEPVPASLQMAHLLSMRAQRTRMPRQVAAAAMLALLIGAGGGWLAHGLRPTLIGTGVAALAQEALGVHQAFAASAESATPPLGVGGTAELVSWATHRLGRQISPPDLSRAGYVLLGGRLVATAHGTGCMFLYQGANNNRITVFMRPMQQPGVNARMQEVEAKDAIGYAWARHGLGVSLVSTAALPVLRDAAETVRAQLDAGA